MDNPMELLEAFKWLKAAYSVSVCTSLCARIYAHSVHPWMNTLARWGGHEAKSQRICLLINKSLQNGTI